MKSQTQKLRDAGFDESWYDRSSRTWVVVCSACAAMVINGTPCHEKGCPNNYLKEE